MLEDELEDVISKSIRGQHLSLNAIGLTKQTNLNNLTKEQLATVASQLNLNHNALVGHSLPFQHQPLPAEVTMVTSRFGHLGVNAFFVESPQGNYLIDTGTEPQKLQCFTPDLILITHRHPDHTGGLSHFDTQVFTPETPHSHDLGNIKTFVTSGHYTPSLAYFFANLSTPCCFVGDAIFKRSIGGTSAPSSYRASIRNVKNLLHSLPAETILCVGHGPNTTVAQELKENPFLAE